MTGVKKQEQGGSEDFFFILFEAFFDNNFKVHSVF